MIPGVLGGNEGFLAADNGIDKMEIKVSKRWRKVPAACARHSARGSDCRV